MAYSIIEKQWDNNRSRFRVMQKVKLSSQQINWVKKKLENGLTWSKLALNKFDEFNQNFVGPSEFFSANNFSELNLDHGHGDDIQHRTDGVSEFLLSYFASPNRTLIGESWLARPSDPYLSRFAGNLMICGDEVYNRASIKAPPSWELERFINRSNRGSGFLVSKEILADEITLLELKNLFSYVDSFYVEIFDGENFLFFKRNQ